MQVQLEQFLNRLLTLQKPQRLLLIDQLTAKECRFIREVSYNILFNSSMQLTENVRRYFRNNIEHLRLLASIRICAADKRTLLRSKHLLLKRMAAEALHYLAKR